MNSKPTEDRQGVCFSFPPADPYFILSGKKILKEYCKQGLNPISILQEQLKIGYVRASELYNSILMEE